VADKEPTDRETDELVARIALLLTEQGWSHLRTGKVRTDAEARAILKDAAKLAEVDITTSKGDNYIKAKLKG